MHKYTNIYISCIYMIYIHIHIHIYIHIYIYYICIYIERDKQKDIRQTNSQLIYRLDHQYMLGNMNFKNF